MKLFKIVMIVALVMVLGASIAESISPQKECSAIDVKVDVEKTSNGLDNGLVTITLLKGDATSVKYIFCLADGKVLNEGHFDSNSLTGLSKGKYLCIINTSECSKKISFTIK